MKKIFLVFALFFGIMTFSQSKINFDEIKKDVTDSTSTYFYERLIYKYNFNPLSIDSVEAKHLYYGKFNSKYKISDFDAEKFDFMDLFKKRKFEKAIISGEEILKRDPTNLEVLGLILQCYSKKDENNKMYTIHGIQFQKLIECILKNVDEDDKGKLFTVMSVSDEYVVSSILKINLFQSNRSSVMKKDGVIDEWKIKDKSLSFYVIYDMERFKDLK